MTTLAAVLLVSMPTSWFTLMGKIDDLQKKKKSIVN